MCAAYRSARGTEGDLGARLAAIEDHVAELRQLLAGTAGRPLEDRVTAIERLLVRLEAGLSAGRPVAEPSPTAPAAVDLEPLEARLRSIEGTFVAAIDRLAEQVDGAMKDSMTRLEAWRPSDAVADDLATRLSARDRLDEFQQHVEAELERFRERLSQTLEAQPDPSADLAALAARLENLHARLGRVADGDELIELGDRLQARIDAADVSGTVRELQERIDALVRSEDLVALTEDVGRLPDAGAVAAIGARLEQLAGADALAAVADHLERLDIGAPLASLSDRIDELGDRIARRDDLAALRKQVGELARAEDVAVLVDRLERPLSVEGLQGVEDRLDRVLAEMHDRTDEELQADLQRLRDTVGRLARAEDVEALIELVAGIDGRTQTIATAHDVASVRERVGDVQRALSQLDVSETVLPAIREELDRLTTTVLEARRDVAQLAAGDIAELRDRVATLATASDLELARTDVSELSEAIRSLESATARLGGVDAALSGLREHVEGIGALVEDRTKAIADPLEDLHDLVVSRTDALLQPGRIQAALAPMWEGIAGIAEDFASAREAAEGQQQLIDGLGEVVDRVERVASDLRARVEGEQQVLTTVVKEGVASELDAMVDEVRKLGASYHRVATELGEQVQRLRRTSDEVVGALQRRDRLIQDEVVERLVTALDRVIELGGRNRRKVSKALADAAAAGAARSGDWEQPPLEAGPTRVTLRREDSEPTEEPE